MSATRERRGRPGNDLPRRDPGVEHDPPAPGDLRPLSGARGGHDVVLGPAVDGGYYLIGLRRAAPQLFAGVDWGTGRVLAQARAAAGRAGLSVALLPTLADVDVPGDLVACREVLADVLPPLP